MPLPPRSDLAGQFYHALNRGNARQPIFHKEADYEAFEHISKEGLEKPPCGDPGWVKRTARKYNLESTLRNHGRPRKLN
jgi:hypothetical protein